jgi:hypothetical protein
MVKTMTKGERSKKSCENGTNKKNCLQSLIGGRFAVVIDIYYNNETPNQQPLPSL